MMCRVLWCHPGLGGSRWFGTGSKTVVTLLLLGGSRGSPPRRGNHPRKRTGQTGHRVVRRFGRSEPLRAGSGRRARAAPSWPIRGSFRGRVLDRLAHTVLVRQTVPRSSICQRDGSERSITVSGASKGAWDCPLVKRSRASWPHPLRIQPQRVRYGVVEPRRQHKCWSGHCRTADNFDYVKLGGILPGHAGAELDPGHVNERHRPEGGATRIPAGMSPGHVTVGGGVNRSGGVSLGGQLGGSGVVSVGFS